MTFRKSLPLLILAAIGCSREPGPGPTGEGYTDLNADQVMIGVAHTSTADGVRSAVGNYDTVFVFNDSSAYRIKGVAQQLYDVNGAPSANVKADSGVLNLSTDAMVARGSVVLITQNNCRIESEELHYDPQTRRVWSEVFSTFIAGERRATANSFNADDGFQNVTATGLNGTFPEAC